MTKGMRVSAIVIAGAGLVLAIAAVSSAAPSSSDESSASVATELAASRVSGKENVQLHSIMGEDTDGVCLIDEYRDQARGDKYLVERASGRVRGFSDNSAHDDRGSGVGLASITAAAEEIASRSYNPGRLDGMHREARMITRGDETCYGVRYDEYIDGVRTFNYLHLEFSPDGRLISSLQQDEDVTVSLKPSLDVSSAIEIVAAKSGFLKWADQEAELVAYRALNSAQRLTWEVTLHTGNEAFGSSFWGRVDAHSGELIDYASTD